MKKLFKSLISLAVIIIFIVMLFNLGILSGSLHETVRNIASPVVDALGYPARAVSGIKKLFAEKKQLVLENNELKERVKELERLYNAKRELEINYKNLEELSEIQNQYDYDVLPARIVLKDDSLWSKTIVINKGKRDGVVLNMAVVSGAGLVGKIIQVGYAYSRVLLVIDKSFKAGAMLRDTRYTGLVEGRGVNELVLNYLPKSADIEPGDEIITSGLGGIFPAGYLIGTAKDQSFQEYGFYQYSTIKPAVDFNNLELVAVVKRLPPEIDVGE